MQISLDKKQTDPTPNTYKQKSILPPTTIQHWNPDFTENMYRGSI